MPYWCPACKQHFSVRDRYRYGNARRSASNSAAIAIYLHLTSLKGVSSMKLHRDIGVTQKTAWFMRQRIREAWSTGDLEQFIGPVEMDETYMGGRERNKHKSRKLKAGSFGHSRHDRPCRLPRIMQDQQGRGPKSPRTPTPRPYRSSWPTMLPQAQRSIPTMRRPTKACPSSHESVRHSLSASTSATWPTPTASRASWAMLKRVYQGTYGKISGKAPATLRRRILQAVTASASAIPLTRWRWWLQGWSGSGSRTGHSRGHDDRKLRSRPLGEAELSYVGMVCLA